MVESFKAHQQLIHDCFSKYSTQFLVAYCSFSLLLYCHGKALYNSNKRSYPLHKAVFESNLQLVSRLITCQQDDTLFCDKNELDCCGNTPLILAIKLKNRDAVKILTDLYCSSKLNPINEILSAFEIAKAQKDRNLIEILMESELKLKQHYLELHKEAIYAVLERLPDFNLDLRFECTSSVLPNAFTQSFTPNDTYHIMKSGSNLRLDMHLIGVRKFGQSIRGNISVLFKGRTSETNAGELLVIDYEKNRVTSIFEDATLNRVERDLENIMSDEHVQKHFNTERFQLELERDRHGQKI